MTYHAIKAIKEADYRLTYDELHKNILTAIESGDSKYKDQNPGLEAKEEHKKLFATTAGPGLSLRIGASRYWDCFDFAEGLSHEAAHHYLSSRGKNVRGAFRKSLGEPFDLLNRHCGLGFGTLTIRCGESGTSFYLHRRGDQVAVGKHDIGLVPARASAG